MTMLSKIKCNWGWVVTIAAAFLFIVAQGFLLSFGLVMVEFIEEFNSDVTTTGYLGTVAYGCSRIFCIFATPIVGRIGYRPAAILGVVICSISPLATSFMPSILPIFGTYSLLYAVGNSLLLSAAFLAIMAYFPLRHTSTALGIATAGVNTGILVFNPLMYAMMSRWGWRNALRIVCAIELSIGLPCTMAFSQPSSSSPSSSLKQNDYKAVSRSLNEIQIKPDADVCNGSVVTLKDDIADGHCPTSKDVDVDDDSHHQVTMTPEKKASYLTHNTDARDEKEHLGLMVPPQFMGGGDNSEARRMWYGKWLMLFSYPDVWLLGVGVLLGNICVAFIYFSTVNFIVLAGFSKWAASMMMATMGLTEIVGKIIIGVVSDRIPVPKLFYMVAADCLGAAMLYASFHAKTEAVMYVIIAVEGCFVMAPLDSLAHSVANQLYDASLKSNLWSYIMLVCGVGGILAAIFGQSVDRTGSYNTALYIVIGVCFTAALFLILVPVYQRAFCIDRYILFENARRLGKGEPDNHLENTKADYELLPQKQRTDEKLEMC